MTLTSKFRPDQRTLPDGGRKPNDPNALTESNDGSLGDASRGEFVPMYGPVKKLKYAKPRILSYNEGTKRIFRQRGIKIEEVNTDQQIIKIENLLFSYEWPENRDEPMFIQQQWPTDDGDIFVRALHPEALKGDGALVRSNPNRVYVIDATLPTHVRRGYLAVKGLDMVETFLGAFDWRSRSEGYRNSNNDEGISVPSFVVKDYMTHEKSRAYYVAPRRSHQDVGRIICHLKPIGFIKEKLRLTGLVPTKGQSKLSEWVSANFTNVHTLLFD